jgi:hypothetical protein
VNRENHVVTVHSGATTTSGSLNLRFADVKGVSLNFRDESQTLTETGQNPSIALSNANDVLVMYDRASKLYYQLGLLNITTSASGRTYSFGDSSTAEETFTNQELSCTDPSVGLSSSGVVVEVHRCGEDVYWRRGLLSNNALSFNNSQTLLAAKFDNPSVAVNVNRKAVAVFEKDGNLYYSVGTFTTDVISDSITWGSATQFDTADVAGNDPSVALTDADEVIAVFKRGSPSQLYQAFGRITAGNTVQFIDPLDLQPEPRKFYRYDSGETPQVATNGNLAVQVFKQGASMLLGNAALIFDHASWMSDNRLKLQDKTLIQIALPGSHDAGAFADNDGQTQDIAIRNQLRYGVHYFDIRPKYDGPIPADTTSLIADKIVTFHDVGDTDYTGPRLNDVVSRVASFMQNHQSPTLSVQPQRRRHETAGESSAQ